MRKIADTVDGNVLIEMTAGEWEGLQGISTVIPGKDAEARKRDWPYTEAGRLLYKAPIRGKSKIKRLYVRGKIEADIATLWDIANDKIPIEQMGPENRTQLRELLEVHANQQYNLLTGITSNDPT